MRNKSHRWSVLFRYDDGPAYLYYFRTKSELRKYILKALDTDRVRWREMEIRNLRNDGWVQR